MLSNTHHNNMLSNWSWNGFQTGVICLCFGKHALAFIQEGFVVLTKVFWQASIVHDVLIKHIFWECMISLKRTWIWAFLELIFMLQRGDVDNEHELFELELFCRACFFLYLWDQQKLTASAIYRGYINKKWSLSIIMCKINSLALNSNSKTAASRGACL